LLAQTELVLSVYEEHAFHENNVILPAAVKFNPVLVKHLEEDHAEDKQIAEKVLAPIKAWRVANTDEARWDAGREILYTFSNFAAFNLAHMNLEETLLNDELWKHYTDAELLAMIQEIGKAVTPERTLLFNQWMLRAIDPAEALAMLQGAQKNAPATFNMLAQFAQENFSVEKWHFVSSRLAGVAQ